MTALHECLTIIIWVSIWNQSLPDALYHIQYHIVYHSVVVKCCPLIADDVDSLFFTSACTVLYCTSYFRPRCRSLPDDIIPASRAWATGYISYRRTSDDKCMIPVYLLHSSYPTRHGSRLQRWSFWLFSFLSTSPNKTRSPPTNNSDVFSRDQIQSWLHPHWTFNTVSFLKTVLLRSMYTLVLRVSLLIVEPISQSSFRPQY